MTKTQRGKYVFTVKEFHDGTPWIAFEPYGKGVNFGVDGHLGFDLLKGTTYDEAKDIAKFLNDKISKLSFTNNRRV